MLVDLSKEMDEWTFINNLESKVWSHFSGTTFVLLTHHFDCLDNSQISALCTNPCYPRNMTAHELYEQTLLSAIECQSIDDLI